MSKQIHIYLHGSTKDAGFEESKHPRAAKKEAGGKGQEALDLAQKAEGSDDPKVVKKAAQAAQEASQAHERALEAFSKVPFPGNSYADEHHAERAKAHKVLAAELNKRLESLSKPGVFRGGYRKGSPPAKKEGAGVADDGRRQAAVKK